MGAAQPLNTRIAVFRRARVVRDNARHTTVKHLTTPWGDQYVPAPGEETEVLEVRDIGFRTDAFRYGHPVVVLPRPRLLAKDAIKNIPGTKTVVMFGNLREIQLEPANRYADFYAELRAQSAGTFITPP
jgi:hypothetical protein